MKKNTLRLGYLFLIWVAFLNCKSLSGIFSHGTADIALKSADSKEAILFGDFENRGKTGNLNLTKNFSDFLKFHFLQKGYSILEAEKNQPPNSEKSIPGTTPKEKTFFSLTGNEDSQATNGLKKNSIDKAYLQELSAKYSFEYYISGSIGIYNSNNILEERESTLAIIRIHDKRGELIGISSFSIQTEAGSDPFTLSLTALKIASIFQEKISTRGIAK